MSREEASPNPRGTGSQIISVKPVTLAAPERGVDLEARVSAPIDGDRLPVIVFSHGNGWSMDGYGPLADHWAGQGFVVIQPTHLDSRRLSLPHDDPRFPSIWRFRVEDLRRCLDDLDALAAAVPGLAARIDRDRVAVAGHSWGATTASSLLGARVIGADGEPGETMADERVKAGVLLALAGHGGEDLSEFAAQHLPFMNPDFSAMVPPALIVAGDKDQSMLTSRGPDWWTDGYRQSPAPKSLLTLFGAEHSLGGIPGIEARETTDESAERVELLRLLSTAYLRSALGLGDEDWQEAKAELEREGSLGAVESR
jgi:dienelactone hydrolase